MNRGVTRALDAQNFESVIGAPGIVVIDWWAPWCGPCRAFAPIFERAAATNPDAVFGKVNTQEQPELAAEFQIRSIPTLMVNRDGVMLYNRAGMLPPAALDELLRGVRDLDMTAVRRHVDAQRAAV